MTKVVEPEEGGVCATKCNLPICFWNFMSLLGPHMTGFFVCKDELICEE
jgi:hypothetical protein